MERGIYIASTAEILTGMSHHQKTISWYTGMAAKQAGKFLYVFVPLCAELLLLKLLPMQLSVGPQHKPTTKMIKFRIKMRRVVWIADHSGLWMITASFATQLLVKSNRSKSKE